jgi:hypothetical protein
LVESVQAVTIFACSLPSKRHLWRKIGQTCWRYIRVPKQVELDANNVFFWDLKSMISIYGSQVSQLKDHDNMHYTGLCLFLFTKKGAVVLSIIWVCHEACYNFLLQTVYIPKLSIRNVWGNSNLGLYKKLPMGGQGRRIMSSRPVWSTQKDPVLKHKGLGIWFSSRVLVWHEQGPTFNIQHHLKKKPSQMCWCDLS